MSLLPKEQYLDLISKGKLVSIDLILINSKGEALLGFRKNKPAQNYWFVPGGALLKKESIDAGFQRISLQELGHTPCKKDFFALSQHHYEDNFEGAPNIATHYIALGFKAHFEEATPPKDDQHSELRWWKKEDLLSAPSVHPFTKAYFSDSPDSNTIIFRK